jgi:DNA (cytosine-5)-methyltransferase 1
MSEGDTYADLPERLRRYRADIFTDKYNRLSWDDLSRTITAHIARDGYWYIHPDQHRTLSIREAARIQTFPDWFRFAGEPSHRFRLIGNAVPPLLAEAIGRQLYLSMKSSRRAPVRTLPHKVRDRLLLWYQRNGRQFPWRNRMTPWHVLMAEMCLNRMRHDQVASVFRELKTVAPTPAVMVARQRAARRTMQAAGLGHRANSIIAVARALVRRHGGRVPDKRDELLALPGVGGYLANAVLAFGFGHVAPLLDAKTSRVISRYMGRPVARDWQLRLDLYQMAGRQGPDVGFNAALLDLGESVCHATKPMCEECPLRHSCLYNLRTDI